MTWSVAIEVSMANEFAGVVRSAQCDRLLAGIEGGSGELGPAQCDAATCPMMLPNRITNFPMEGERRAAEAPAAPLKPPPPLEPRRRWSPPPRPPNPPP